MDHLHAPIAGLSAEKPPVMMPPATADATATRPATTSTVSKRSGIGPSGRFLDLPTITSAKVEKAIPNPDSTSGTETAWLSNAGTRNPAAEDTPATTTKPPVRSRPSRRSRTARLWASGAVTAWEP